MVDSSENTEEFEPKNIEELLFWGFDHAGCDGLLSEEDHKKYTEWFRKLMSGKNINDRKRKKCKA